MSSLIVYSSARPQVSTADIASKIEDLPLSSCAPFVSEEALASGLKFQS
jgi:hypothetical protein